MEYTAVQDRTLEGAWRVEAIDYENEGVAHIAIFIGPNAEQRAREYATFKEQA